MIHGLGDCCPLLTAAGDLQQHAVDAVACIGKILQKSNRFSWTSVTLSFNFHPPINSDSSDGHLVIGVSLHPLLAMITKVE